MVNWEARSQYILTELVKYEKYMDSLRNAMKERLRRRGEKALEKALQSSSNVANRSNESDNSTQEVSMEGQETETEQLTPGPGRVQFKPQPVQNLQHKRKGAET
jgi:PH and SEC7 domain-containing protein